MKEITMTDDNTIKEATKTTNPRVAPVYGDRSKPKSRPKLTEFRAYFRVSNSNERFTVVVNAKDIGDVHKAVRKEHQTDDINVFIDKVKVLGEES